MIHAFRRLATWTRRPRAQMGIAIGAAAVRAVVVEEGVVRRAAEVPLSGARVEESDLEALLATIGEGTAVAWRGRVAVAIGAADSQAKALDGLPSSPDEAVLTAVVEEMPRRFFLMGPGALQLSLVHAKDGIVYAAAFDARVVAIVESALVKAGFPDPEIVPTASVLSLAFADRDLRWADGDLTYERTEPDQSISSVHWCSASRSVDAPEALLAPALVAVGEGASRFADAFAAATIQRPIRRDQLALHRPKPTTVPRVRALSALVVCSATIILAAAAPMLRANREVDRDATRSTQLRDTLAVLASLDAHLSRVDESIAEAEALRTASVGPLEFLDLVNTALPSRSSLVLLRLDSLGGTLVALTEAPDDLIAALDAIPGVGAPEIVGPLTPEPALGATMQRLTLRFTRVARARENE